MDGSEIFQEYQQEYASIKEGITEKLQVKIPTASIDQKKLYTNQLARELEEADEIIEHMEVELMSLPQPVRNRLLPKVKASKEEVKSFKKELNKIISIAKSKSERDSLLAGSTSIDMEIQSMDQRSRLIHGTERLQDGSRRLEEAQRVALETESIGISTLEDLNRQREQMLRTRETLSTADAWIGKSQGILKSMYRRMTVNKMISGGIIALLVIIILAVVYLKWIA